MSQELGNVVSWKLHAPVSGKRLAWFSDEHSVDRPFGAGLLSDSSLASLLIGENKHEHPKSCSALEPEKAKRTEH